MLQHHCIHGHEQCCWGTILSVRSDFGKGGIAGDKVELMLNEDIEQLLKHCKSQGGVANASDLPFFLKK
jgi:hypothetical protein